MFVFMCVSTSLLTLCSMLDAMQLVAKLSPNAALPAPTMSLSPTSVFRKISPTSTAVAAPAATLTISNSSATAEVKSQPAAATAAAAADKPAVSKDAKMKFKRRHWDYVFENLSRYCAEVSNFM